MPMLACSSCSGSSGSRGSGGRVRGVVVGPLLGLDHLLLHPGAACSARSWPVRSSSSPGGAGGDGALGVGDRRDRPRADARVRTAASRQPHGAVRGDDDRARRVVHAEVVLQAIGNWFRDVDPLALGDGGRSCALHPQRRVWRVLRRRPRPARSPAPSWSSSAAPRTSGGGTCSPRLSSSRSRPPSPSIGSTRSVSPHCPSSCSCSRSPPPKRSSKRAGARGGPGSQPGPRGHGRRPVRPVPRRVSHARPGATRALRRRGRAPCSRRRSPRARRSTSTSTTGVPRPRPAGAWRRRAARRPRRDPPGRRSATARVARLPPVPGLRLPVRGGRSLGGVPPGTGRGPVTHGALPAGTSGDGGGLGKQTPCRRELRSP